MLTGCNPWYVLQPLVRAATPRMCCFRDCFWEAPACGALLWGLAPSMHFLGILISDWYGKGEKWTEGDSRPQRRPRREVAWVIQVAHIFHS